MKKMLLIALAVTAISVSLQSFAATGDCKKNGNTMNSEMVSKSFYGKEQVFTIVNYVKDKDLRSENYDGMGKSRKLKSMTIAKGQVYYILNPAQKTAMKMSATSPMVKGQETKPQQTSWKSALDEFKAQGYTMKERGKETWNGQEYTVWRATEPRMKSYTDYYVQKDGAIKRFVTYDSKNKLLSDSWFEKSDRCLALPAGIFDVPAGYKIQEMPDISNMMKGMKGMPGMEGMEKEGEE